MKLLRDIYILKTDGTVMFKRVFKEKMDAQLFGGFLSALETFASQMNDSGLSSFDLGDKRYIVIRHDDMYFVANYNKKIKQKKAEQELRSVMHHFTETYLVELAAGWNGDTSTFQGFEEAINESLEDLINTFEKAFW